MYKYFKKVGDTDYSSEWKSKGLSDEIFKPPSTTNYSIACHVSNKTRVKVYGSCLKQDKTTFTHGIIVNIYIVYELSFSSHKYDDYPTLKNYLFGAVKLTKNADIDFYKYHGYGILFNRRGAFSFPSGRRSYTRIRWF